MYLNYHKADNIHVFCQKSPHTIWRQSLTAIGRVEMKWPRKTQNNLTWNNLNCTKKNNNLVVEMHCYTYVLEDWGYKNRLMFFFVAFSFLVSSFTVRIRSSTKCKFLLTQKVLVPLPKGEQVRLPLGGQVPLPHRWLVTLSNHYRIYVCRMLRKKGSEIITTTLNAKWQLQNVNHLKN